MGVVKYTGPMASFHCPTNAEIRSLKVHFSPKQEGSGDPSPENVRPIEGWDGVEITHSKKNLFNGIIKVGRDTTGDGTLDGSNTWRTSEPILVKPNTSYTVMNGTALLTPYINIYDNNMNLLRTYTTLSIILTPENAKYITLQRTRTAFESMLNDVAVYESNENIKINYEFGVLGKNKFNPEMEWTFGKTYTYAYLPELENLCNISFTLKDSTIDVSDVSVGFSYYEPNAVSEINKGYRWCLGNGVIKTYAKTNTVRDGNSTEIKGKICTYLVVNSSSQETFQDKYNRLISAYDIQIEYGDTATTYEPYNPKHTVYGGWVDLISGEAQEGIDGYPYDAIILDGTENWTLVDQDDNTTIFRYNYRGKAKTESKSICSHFKVQLVSHKDLSYPNTFVHGVSGNLYIQPDNLIASTVDEFKNYLSTQYQNGTPVTILFQKNNTINTYYLAPTELQTFLGHNNVWSNADYVEVEYDLHETQEILNRKAFIMANQPHLVAPEAAQLQSFTTDLAAPLKECKAYFKPKQDFNGYDRPWPAGGGKNIAKPYDNSYISSTYISFDYSAANGTFRCYGTASASSTHASPSATNAVNNGATFTLPADTYTLSIIDGDGANIYAQCVSSTETVLAETTSYTTFTTNESLTVFVRLKVAAAATVDKTVKIQLEKGSAATSYAPYENICSIEGWNQIDIYKGKDNLFSTYNIEYNKWINSSGAVISDASYGCITQKIPVNGGIYSLKALISPYSMSLIEYDANGIFIKRNHRSGSSSPSSFELTTNTKYVAVQVASSSSNASTITEDYLNNHSIILIQGTETPIIYNNPLKYSIDWTDSTGTIYGGYVDLVRGEVVATWKELDLSTTKWSYAASTNRFETQYLYDADRTRSLITAISDTYLSVVNQTGGSFNTSIGDMAMCFNISSGYPYIVLHDSRFTSAEELISSFNGHQMFYKLAEPIHYSIDPITLKTLRGQNNIWSNSNGNITVQFWRH